MKNNLKNYYNILDIDEKATEEDIYNSYRKKISQFNGLPFHTQQMISIIKELKEAIYILGNINKRQKYNLKLINNLKYTQSNYNENTQIYNRTFEKIF